MMKKAVFVILLIGGILGYTGGCAWADPWRSMQELFPAPAQETSVTPEETVGLKDPWQALQQYFIPFTEEQEVAALTDRIKAVALAGKLHQRLYPYRAYIAEAATRFQVPAEIIGAVIMVESSGNPRAAAKTSSAKGLMQTIDSTFAMARGALAKDGLYLADSAYNPRSSIMTGSWYLGRMYAQAVRDGRLSKGGRSRIEQWRLPAEYYYAGPGNGKKMHDVVITYAGGQRIIIDKPAYSQKVLRWAGIMAVPQ